MLSGTASGVEVLARTSAPAPVREDVRHEVLPEALEVELRGDVAQLGALGLRHPHRVAPRVAQDLRDAPPLTRRERVRDVRVDGPAGLEKQQPRDRAYPGDLVQADSAWRRPSSAS